MKKVLVQQVAFQGVWLACALGGAAGTSLPGLSGAGCFVAVHLALSKSVPRELALVGSAAAFGGLLDLLMVRMSLVDYPGSPLSLGPSPAWMLGLWAAFSLTLPVAFAWLRGRAATAALLGGIGGIVAYSAGGGLGALTVDSTGGWIAIGLGWALAMPALIRVAEWLNLIPADSSARLSASASPASGQPETVDATTGAAT